MEHITKKTPQDSLFVYRPDSLLDTFERDCKVAGIPYMSENGRTIDVHSLRRTYGTMLARAGVPLATTQRLMRHSKPETTAKLYIDVEEIDIAVALGKLPDITLNLMPDF